jgi:hypothetical protein
MFLSSCPRLQNHIPCIYSYITGEIEAKVGRVDIVPLSIRTEPPPHAMPLATKTHFIVFVISFFSFG